MANGILIFPDEYWDLEEKGEKLPALEFMEMEARRTKDPDIYFFLGQEFGVYSDRNLTDYARAFEWFNQGALVGDAPCIYESGIALLAGLGVPNDKLAGLGRIREAARMGNEVALDFLLSEQFQSEYHFSLTLDEVKEFSSIRAKHNDSKA